MKYKYLGNTIDSLAFGAIDENSNYTDFGVFLPQFTKYFSEFIDSEGKFSGESEAFFNQCDKYIYYVVNWVFPERPLRVCIPNELVTRAQIASAAGQTDTLGQLGSIIDAVYPAQTDFIIVNHVYADIYLNYILPEHLIVLDSFIEIKIEAYE